MGVDQVDHGAGALPQAAGAQAHHFLRQLHARGQRQVLLARVIDGTPVLLDQQRDVAAHLGVGAFGLDDLLRGRLLHAVPVHGGPQRPVRLHAGYPAGIVALQLAPAEQRDGGLPARVFQRVQLLGLCFFRGHLVQPGVMAQGQLPELLQRRQRAGVDKQRCAWLHGLFAVQQALQGGLGQRQIALRLELLTSCLLQCHAGLQPVHARNHADLQQTLRGVVVLGNGAGGLLAQGHRTACQLHAEIALHQRVLELVRGGLGIGLGFILLGGTEILHGLRRPAGIHRPHGTDCLAVARALQVVGQRIGNRLGQAGGQLPHGLGQRAEGGQQRAQFGQPVADFLLRLCQIQFAMQAVAGVAGRKPHDGPAQTLQALRLQALALHGGPGCGKLVGYLQQAGAGVLQAQGRGRRRACRCIRCALHGGRCCTERGRQNPGSESLRPHPIVRKSRRGTR